MRKSAGTHGFLDVIRHAAGGPAGDPAADLHYFEAGGTVAVPAFRRDGDRLRRGRLEVAASGIIWRPRFGAAVVLPPPRLVTSVGFINSTAVNSHMFRLISVSAADTAWEFAVPMTDVPLLQAAFGG